MPSAKIAIRWLGLLLLLAICTPMAECIAADHCDAAGNFSVPAGSDCGCHDCACCSLHVGFPVEAHLPSVGLIIDIPETSKSNREIDHPPRS